MLFVGKSHTAAVGAVVNTVGAGWEKIINGELNTAEGVAGLCCGMVAGFLWYAKVVNGDKHLHVADKLNYCKKADGCINCGCAFGNVGYNVTAKCFTNTVGYAARRLIAVAYNTNFCRKRYRVNGTHNAFGCVAARKCVNTVIATFFAYNV